ncbi:MAG: hypothetical protein K8R35_08495 [Bacteroidales bacterium]|nr:hypothetical protein [Bacteroidales bacterium]
MNYQEELKRLKPGHEYFVGIDSDGCVFDTMEVKQKEFFIPNGIKYFNLFSISKIVRETWEFVNLYSIHRGVNRFPALVKVFELLAQRKEIIESKRELPDITALKNWISRETKLGNQTLQDYVKTNPDPFLERVLQWSLSINEDIGTWLKGVTPFSHVIASLEKISFHSDSIVVSQTPLEALTREWEEHKIDHLVNMIAGQEHGTKTEHLAFAANGKYADNKILMIGDAPGDLEAATNNGVCFYPIIPGKEADSWQRLHSEAFNIFLNGSYKGAYENLLLKEFKNALPEKPFWQ